MSKKILTAITLVITFFVLAVCMNANTETFDSGDFSFQINEDGETVTLTKYLGSDSVVTVPETVEYEGKSYTVSKLGSRAFYECVNMTKIEIPECVTFIDGYTFAYCSSLTEISLPKRLDYIGYASFFN